MSGLEQEKVTSQHFSKYNLPSRVSEGIKIYNGILLSHKKERTWVICRDVDGPREYHTGWSKSEREKQMSYDNAYVWNLEKMV